MKGFDKASMVRRNKLINNLPKYDVGTTPINSGYQRAMNSIPVPFVSLLGLDLSLMASEQKLANIAQIVNSGAQLATQATGIVDIGKQLKNGAFGEVGSLAAKGTAAGLNAVATIPSAMKLYGAINTKNSFDGLGGNDLNLLASKNTEYRNGVAYENIGGVDSGSIMDAARAREFGENVNLTTNAIATGAGFGAAIGSFFPGAGNLIGAGIGTIVGGLGSLFGWNNDEVKEQRRRLQNWRIASKAANTQNEAVASSTGLRNEFYATHADKGLSPAFVGGGETKVATNGEGKVTDYIHFLETGATPRHADNILTQMKDTDGVLGNTVDPFTGRLVSDESRDVIYDPTLTKNQKNNLLTQFLWNQDVALKGKNANMKIGRFDRGRYMGLLSMLPGIMEMGVGAKQAHSYAKDPAIGYNPYTINNNAAQALDILANRRYSPYPILNRLNDDNSKTVYAINTAPYSPALRAAMLSTYYNNRMRNKADVLANAQEVNNRYLGEYANAALQEGGRDAQLRYAGNGQFFDSLAKAKAAKRKGIETGWQTGLKGINAVVGNLLNNYWRDRAIKLYQQEASGRLLSQNMQDAANAKNAGVPLSVPFSFNNDPFGLKNKDGNFFDPTPHYNPRIEIGNITQEVLPDKDDGTNVGFFMRKRKKLLPR